MALVSGTTINIDTESKGSATATSVTVSHAVNAANNQMLIVQAFADFNVAGNITGVTYGGVAMTRIDLQDSGRIGAWYLLNPSAGTANIVVSQSVSRTVIAFGTSVQGVSNSPPFGFTAYAATGTAPFGVACQSSGGYVVLEVSGDSGGTTTWTAAGAQTASTVETLGTVSAVKGIAPGNFSAAMTWSVSGQNLPRNLGFSVFPINVTYPPSRRRSTIALTADPSDQDYKSELTLLRWF